MKGRRVPPKTDPRELPMCSPESEAASDADRLWFEAHPGASSYIRAYQPGEFPCECFAPEGYVILMHVTQLAPGIRSRRPFAAPVTIGSAA